MKIINKNFKNGALAVAFLMFGTTTSVLAQGGVHSQTQNPTATTTQDQMDYEEIFNDVGETASHSALDLLKQDDNFSTFIELLESSGLEKSLSVQEEVTIFAPTNEAFEQMRKEEYDKLKDPQNRGDLIRIINGHMVARKIYANEFQSNHVLESTDGDIVVETAGEIGAGAMPNAIIIGGAEIMRPDIEAENGIIHVVNRIVRSDGNTAGFY